MVVKRTIEPARDILAEAIQDRLTTNIVGVARAAGVSSAHLYDILRSRKAASVDFLAKVAAALKVQPCELLLPRTTAERLHGMGVRFYRDGGVRLLKSRQRT